MLLQCLIVIFFILLIADRWKPRKFMKVHQLIGNDWRYLPVLGNAMNLIGNNQDRMTTFMKASLQSYKRKHKSVSLWIGNVFVVGIADADLACVVLKSALDKKYLRIVTRDFFGNGSLFAPETVFGINVDIQRKPDHPFFGAVKQLLKNIAARVCQPWLYIDTIYKLLPVYGRQMRMRKICNEFIEELITKNQVLLNKEDGSLEKTDHAADDSEPAFKTFVDLMRENSKKADKVYTTEELREEIFTLATAGTDTSTVGTCFTLMLLAQHADIQDRVYREIQEVFGDSEKPLQSEDLLKLKYTRAVIKETLRLYPPAPFIVRHCKKDLELPSGLVLPEGCNVAINIWGIQRNPEHWGEDADDFNPDRFITGQIPNPNAFLAFSHGARNCVGQQYAMLSMSTTLVTMLRRYRFIPATNFTNDKKNPFQLSFDLMLKDVGNFAIQIEHRDKFKQN